MVRDTDYGETIIRRNRHKTFYNRISLHERKSVSELLDISFENFLENNIWSNFLFFAQKLI